ncbi:Alpha/beta hydrolase fold-1 [Microdochium bolleyi]|uniref:Alpha/beta hydrolase fold-1 n=1 Tax=Microdochium bolleyi TaxID=196109 RepID=A0A136IUE9_9PEZI|nr:Alpha/beta hydrolase fold-1 [Microdochium bolleyi]
MTTKENKPIVVLVHGACHTPGHFDLLLRALRADYQIIVPALPSVGWDDRVSGKSWTDDVALLHSLIDPHLDKGRQAIILGHSYGGVVVTHYAVGQSVAERAARGQKGGVVAVFYLAAIALPAGKAVSDVTAESTALKVQDIDADIKVSFLNAAAGSILYAADLADLYRGQPGAEAAAQAKSDALIALCGGHSIAAFGEPTVHAAAEVAAPKTYFVCVRDEALVPATQREMAKSCGAERVVELDAGHSPFLVGRHVKTIVQELATAANTAVGSS